MFTFPKANYIPKCSSVNFVMRHEFQSESFICEATCLCESICFFSVDIKQNNTIFWYMIFFLNTCPWSWWGRKSKKVRQKYNSNQRSGLQTKIFKKVGKNQTQSRFKDLPEEDSEAESRPDPNHILAFTKTNDQLPASSVTMLLLSMLCI